MSVNVTAATKAYFDQCTAYVSDPNRGPVPPAPPSMGVGLDAQVAVAQALAIVIEQHRTGSTEPGPQSISDAAKLLDCIDYETGQLDSEAYEQLKTELGLRS